MLQIAGYRPKLRHGWHLGSPLRIPHDATILIRPHLLHDRAYRVEAGATRIVCLGDSFTEGHPVELEFAYPALLERRLRSQDWNVSVLNLGIGDSGPDQHLRFFEHDVLPRLSPDIVVWQLYYNDVHDNLWQATYTLENGSLVPLDTRRSWILKRKRAFDSIPLPVSVKQESPVLRLLLRTFALWGHSQIPGDNDEEREAWALAKLRLEIDQMALLGREHDFEILYVLPAPQAVYLAREDPGRWQNSWEHKQHFLVYDLLGGNSRFLDATFAGSPELFADGARDTAPLGARHFDEAGYEALADAIADRLSGDSFRGRRVGTNDQRSPPI